MCGISGFSLSPNDPTVTNSRLIAGTLLLGIEHRGRDATGACWFDPHGNPFVQKGAFTASAFVRNLSMWKKTTDAILHTRAWTQGEPTNNDNNHPIVSGPVIGVHNGGIWNDYDLFHQMRDVERIAEVDSEAAFAAIAFGIGRLKDGNAKNIIDCLEEIEGGAALAWYDSDDDHRTLHLARLSSSPLVIAQNQYGSLFFASTKQSIVDALAKTNGSDIVFMEELKEGTYMAVREGRVLDCMPFTPAQRYSYSKQSWNSYKSFPAPSVITPTKKVEKTVAPLDYDYDLSTKFFDLELMFNYSPADLEFDYRQRESDIEDHDVTYGKGYSNSIGAKLYPSMWVKAVMLDQEYWGQIIEMPDVFPEGKYTIRLYVNRKGQEMEIVYVQRTVYELEWDFPTENTDLSDELIEMSELPTPGQLFPTYY
jgi:hypothetical protein